MIDQLKNYRELSNNSGYTGSLRYCLAKKKLDTLFLKWLYNNRPQVEDLFKKTQTSKLKVSEEPNPLFSHHRVPHQITNPSISIIPNSPNTPTKEKREYPDPSISFSKRPSTQQHESPYKSKTNPLTKSIKPEQVHEIIPQFYFPQGKPLESVAQSSYRSQINSIFGNKNDVDLKESKKLVVDLMGLPNYFSTCLLSKLTNQKKIMKLQFNRFWKEVENKEIEKRAFLLLTSDKQKKYLVIEDFKKIFKQILATHPGLDFLKQTPEFQQWYSLCVINRMFFMANRKNDYKMSYREFKRSKILRSLYDIEAENDINQNKDFFSYEDFYVIYMKFWELDSDHDFLLTKEQLSKYSGYTLSRKTIDRVFLQIGRKFQNPQKMTFGDFVWFIYCVQDKSTEQSLEYWFKVLDLDQNGVVSGYELEYFYEEQSQRLAYMDGNSNDFNFENIVCQMVDLMKPANGVQFTLEHFLNSKEDCGLFINFLTDLNKLVAFEQRDAYQEKNEKTEHPQWTQWDRFVKPEYKKLESLGQNDEVDEILNWENDQI